MHWWNTSAPHHPQVAPSAPLLVPGICCSLPSSLTAAPYLKQEGRLSMKGRVAHGRRESSRERWQTTGNHGNRHRASATFRSWCCERTNPQISSADFLQCVSFCVQQRWRIPDANISNISNVSTLLNSTGGSKGFHGNVPL